MPSPWGTEIETPLLYYEATEPSQQAAADADSRGCPLTGTHGQRWHKETLCHGKEQKKYGITPSDLKLSRGLSLNGFNPLPTPRLLPQVTHDGSDSFWRWQWRRGEAVMRFSARGISDLHLNKASHLTNEVPLAAEMSLCTCPVTED